MFVLHVLLAGLGSAVNRKYSFSRWGYSKKGVGKGSDLSYRDRVPANIFWYISMRFLSWEYWDFWRRQDHFRRFPKKSEVFRRRPKSAEGEVIEKTPIHKIRDRSFIHFTHGFRSLHGSELTYFWKLCPARRQQLTFFNQAWEIGPQAWAGVRSKFSTRVRVGRYIFLYNCIKTQSPRRRSQ